MTVVEVVPGEYRYYLLSTGKSVGTIRQRLGDITRFARTRASLFDVVTGDLVSYLGRGAEHDGWSLEYLKKIRSSFRSFYRWAHKSGLIGTDPAYELDAIRIPRALPHPTPEPVVQAAFQRAPVPVRAMLLLAATERLRRSKIAALHPQARVGDTIRFRGKDARDRVVPLDELTYGLLLALEALQGKGVFYFPGRFGGHVHDSTVYRWVTALTPGWSLHSLRHRAATAAYAGTHDLRAPQEMLGHASPATTQIYTAIDLSQVRQAVQGASLSRFRGGSGRHG